MKAGARSQGLDIYIVSAFRSVERQIGIITRKLRAGLTVDQIIKVSAPPYFSEHHTGLAVDVGTPGCEDLERGFDKTLAFVWLLANARSFGFEMSYGINNVEGFSYEPWHWRFTRS
jgi:D-alanyl-D-alanine carboxypeptidase